MVSRAMSIMACLFSFAALILSFPHASKWKPYLFPVASIGSGREAQHSNCVILKNSFTPVK